MHASGVAAQGFFVPEFALLPPTMFKRDLTATGGASTGGDFIMTEVVPSLIPLLRNKTVVGRMGARMMGGLVNNLTIPRQDSAATASWNTEVAALTATAQTIDNISLSPNRLGGWTNFSKLLLQQSVIDVQGFVRDDLMKIVFIELDRAALNGSGSNMPVGILQTTADTTYPSALAKTSPSVNFGSGYPSWTSVVAFEGNVESNNIDLSDPSVGYVTTPAVKSLWKTLSKADPRATNQFYPSFFWEEGAGDFGEVNGYKALASKQIPSDLVLFGKFDELIVATWGSAFHLVVDPFVLATQAEIRVIINTFVDTAVRYAPAFAYSTAGGLYNGA